MNMKACRLLPVAALLFLAGCATPLPPVHAISIDPQITRPDHLTLTNQTTANIQAFSFIGSTLGDYIGKGISSAATARPRRTLESESQGFDIAGIVRSSFTRQVKTRPSIPRARNGPGDATFHIQILDYGIGHQGGIFSSDAVAPFVTVQVTLVRNNGDTLFCSPAIECAASDWHHLNDYLQIPALIRAGWQQAADDATLDIVNCLTQCQCF